MLSNTGKKEVNKNDKKFLLARELTIWVCLDLLPFTMVEKDGFVNFFLRRKIVSSRSDIPHPTTLANAALDDIYTHSKNMTNVSLSAETPHLITVCYDMWTDSHQQTPYIAVSVQYIDNNFQMQNRLLGLKYFEHPHTICYQIET
jgi:hypothetical protein